MKALLRAARRFQVWALSDGITGLTSWAIWFIWDTSQLKPIHNCAPYQRDGRAASKHDRHGEQSSLVSLPEWLPQPSSRLSAQAQHSVCRRSQLWIWLGQRRVIAALKQRGGSPENLRASQALLVSFHVLCMSVVVFCELIIRVRNSDTLINQLSGVTWKPSLNPSYLWNDTLGTEMEVIVNFF